MKVRNISKKIIGNQSFRLLPGETMEVQGDELWVRDYTAEKKLETIAAADDGEAGHSLPFSDEDPGRMDDGEAGHSLPFSDEDPGRMDDGSVQNDNSSGQADNGEAQDEAKEDEAKAASRGRKK